MCIGKGDKRIGSENERTLSILFVGVGWIGATHIFVFGLHVCICCVVAIRLCCEICKCLTNLVFSWVVYWI